MLHSWPDPPRLRQLRSRAMLTQDEVQSLTGVCRKSLSNWETGRTKPTTECLRKVLAIYDKQIQMHERREQRWEQTG